LHGYTSCGKFSNFAEYIYNNGYSNTNIEYSGEAMQEILAQTVKSPPLALT
jgi:hypothetical protein